MCETRRPILHGADPADRFVREEGASCNSFREPPLPKRAHFLLGHIGARCFLGITLTRSAQIAFRRCPKGNIELFELANTLRKAPPKEVQFYLDAKVRDLFLSWVGWPDPILETKTINRQLVAKTAHLLTRDITRT